MSPRIGLSPSAKVGITTIAVLIVVLFAGTFLDWFKLSRRSGYELLFHFDSIRGLRRGAEVQLNGRPVGEVVDWSPASDQGTNIRVRFWDTQSVVHQNATAVITAESVLGQKLINIIEPLSAVPLHPKETPGQWPDPRQPEFRIERGALEPGDPVYRQQGASRQRIGVVAEVLPLTTEYSRIVLQLMEGQQIYPVEALVPRRIIDDVPRTAAIVYPPIEPGDYLEGKKEPEASDIITSVDEVIKEVNLLMQTLSPEIRSITRHLDEVLVGVRDILDKQQIDGLFDALQREIADTGRNLDLITSDLRAILAETQPALRDTLASAQRATENVEAITGEVNSLVADPEIRGKLESMLGELEASSRNLNQVLQDIQKLTGDEAFQSDIKGTVSAARSTLEKADTTLQRVNQTAAALGGYEAGGWLRERYLPEEERAYTDVRLEVKKPGDHMFYLGASDIGEGSRLDAGYGTYLTPGIVGRGGVRRGKAGIGADFLFDPLSLHADLYDANDPALDLFAAWALDRHWSLLVGAEDILNEDTDRWSLGAAFRF